MKRGILAAVALICATVLAACGSEGGASTQPHATPSNADSKNSTTATRQVTSTVIPPSATSTLGDNAGPIFSRIVTSSSVFAKSDCTPTSITVTANITDPSAVAYVVLWYRVGSSQPYSPVGMSFLGGNDYSVTVKGLEVPGSKYGVWEFYITAQDGVGNLSQSPVDTHVQLLPCVG